MHKQDTIGKSSSGPTPSLVQFSGLSATGVQGRKDDKNNGYGSHICSGRLDSAGFTRYRKPGTLWNRYAIEFIADDEFVEVTPKNLRMRKKVLQFNNRPRKNAIPVGAEPELVV